MAKDIKERVREIISQHEQHRGSSYSDTEKYMFEQGYIIATMDAAYEDHLKYDCGMFSLVEIVARSLTAWDTSKDKSQGLLPEVYLHLKGLYKRLVGVDYSFSDAIKKFDI